MAKAPEIDQLDPFKDEDDFRSDKIRNSRSRDIKSFFVHLISPQDEKEKHRLNLIICLLLSPIIIVVLIVLLIPKPDSLDETFGDDPSINPTGREATSEYNGDVDDPELRAGEEEKLISVLALITAEDWEYANALFETIFPNYLDTCGKYEYYRAAVSLANNFEPFAIPLETAESRMNALLPRCNNVVEPAEPKQEEQDEAESESEPEGDESDES